MAVDIRRDLVVRYGLVSKSIDEIEKKIRLLPKGRINVRTRNGKTYYYLAETGAGERYLGTEDWEFIEQLIQKKYLKDVLRKNRTEATALEKMIKIYPETLAEDLYDQLPEGFKKLAKPIIPFDESYANKWMEMPYKHKPFKKDAPVYLTTKGERVRSKSEVIIAERMRIKGVPYRYECPLIINGKIIHPDFTILRMSDRKILYLEHCGRMDDPKYTEDMIKRANDYSEAGIILGDRLFYTFESDTTPLDVKVIDRLIEENFM